MSAARRSLIALLQLTTAREIAARCGVVAPCVSKWLAGYSRPSDVPRARLESIYGIRASSWGGRAVSTSAQRRFR